MKGTKKRERRCKDDMPKMDPEQFRREYDLAEGEIKRIFGHLYQSKYPVCESMSEAFNQVFVGLYELNVFQRWSVARVVKAEIKRRTGSDDKAEEVYRRLIKSGSDEAEKMALSMGINLKAKRGQFLYKWIEHILGDAYIRKGRELRRFMPLKPEMALPSFWSSCKGLSGFSPWAARMAGAPCDDVGAGAGGWGIAPNHGERWFPHYEDTPTCVGEHTFTSSFGGSDKESIDNDMMKALDSESDERDKFIVQKRMEGFSIHEISEQIKSSELGSMSHQTVANRIRVMRRRRSVVDALNTSVV